MSKNRKPKRPGRPRGFYESADSHITKAGLTITKAAEISKVSQASIRRILNGEAVLASTIAKLINSLNDHHFDKKNESIEFDVEFVQQTDSS